MNSLFADEIRRGAWWVVLAAFAALIPMRAMAQASTNDLVRIEARVQTEQERKDIKGTTVDEVTQNKTLFITITGKAKSPESRTGTWVAYGRDMKGHDLEEMDRGDFTIDLSKGSQTIESKKISSTYTREHSVAGTGKRKTSKKVEAEGKKYAGYVVTVKDGDKVVGQFSDPPGFHSQVR